MNSWQKAVIETEGKYIQYNTSVSTILPLGYRNLYWVQEFCWVSEDGHLIWADAAAAGRGCYRPICVTVSITQYLRDERRFVIHPASHTKALPESAFLGYSGLSKRIAGDCSSLKIQPLRLLSLSYKMKVIPNFYLLPSKVKWSAFMYSFSFTVPLLYR